MEGLNVNPANMDPSLVATPSQTLEQIINSNNQEFMRRRQTYNPYSRSSAGPDHGRRSSMLEFSSSNTGDLADFQFDPNPQHQHAQMSNRMTNMMQGQQQQTCKEFDNLFFPVQMARLTVSFIPPFLRDPIPQQIGRHRGTNKRRAGLWYLFHSPHRPSSVMVLPRFLFGCRPHYLQHE